jgi:hypothetical protein
MRSSVAPRLLSAPAWPSVEAGERRPQRGERFVEPPEVLLVDADVVERARALDRVGLGARQREAAPVPVEPFLVTARARMHDADRAHRRRLRAQVARRFRDRQRTQVVRECLRRVPELVVDLSEAAQRIGATRIVTRGLESG